MNRSDLIARLAARSPTLTQGDCRDIVDTILGAISDALVKGRRVEVRGFGSFGVRARPAKLARNPKTGEQVAVAEKCVPYYKAGMPLLAHIQGKPRYTMEQLIAECDPGAPPPVLRDWEDMPAVGLERVAP